MSPLSVKSRDRSCVVKHNSIMKNLSGGPDIVHVGPVSRRYKGTQITESEGHEKSRDGKYREGGPFFTVDIRADIGTRVVNLSGKSTPYTYRYNGPISVPLVPINNGDFSIPNSDSSYLDPIGATAISIIEPSNPNAETGVALGEIMKDKRLPIPVINSWRQRTKLAKFAGSEYLNAVFGWLPLIGDMKDTAQSVRDGNVILENYKNASGSFVHREFDFPDEESVTEDVINSSTRAMYHPSTSVPPFSNGSGPLTRRRFTRVRRRFSGAFTYQAAGRNDYYDRLLSIGPEADKLFGVSLTPDLVWELTPWSWAIDWFSNAGDVLNNVRAFELAGLVMRYGFIMEETSIEDTYSLPSTFLTGLTGSVPPSTITYTVKRRRAANPFGFGLSWDGLSPTQLAITAALGITRLR